MTTVSEHSRAVRGTKRVCQSCEVRFYDLARDPIVCPACAAVFTPVAAVVFEPRSGGSGGKTGWRSKSFRAPEPAANVEAAEAPVPEEELVDDVAEEAPGAAPAEDIVIEEEADEADVTGLLDHDVEQPEER